MTASCPNDCDEPSEIITVEVDPEPFLQVLVEYYTGREGVDDIDARVQGDIPQLRIHVDQDTAYETHNYFYGRRALESRPVTVTDLDDGVVRLKFESTTTVMADRCTQCGSTTHTILGDVSHYGDYDPTTDDDWVAAELV